MSNQASPPASALDIDTVDHAIRNSLRDLQIELDKLQALKRALPQQAGSEDIFDLYESAMQKTGVLFNRCKESHAVLEQRRLDLETARIQQSVYNAHIVSNTEAFASTNTTLQDIRMGVVSNTEALASTDTTLQDIRTDIARLQSSLLSRAENPIPPETDALRERIRNVEAENEQLSNRIRWLTTSREEAVLEAVAEAKLAWEAAARIAPARPPPLSGVSLAERPLRPTASLSALGNRKRDQHGILRNVNSPTSPTFGDDVFSSGHASPSVRGTGSLSGDPRSPSPGEGAAISTTNLADGRPGWARHATVYDIGLRAMEPSETLRSANLGEELTDMVSKMKTKGRLGHFTKNNIEAPKQCVYTLKKDKVFHPWGADPEIACARCIARDTECVIFLDDHRIFVMPRERHVQPTGGPTNPAEERPAASGLTPDPKRVRIDRPGQGEDRSGSPSGGNTGGDSMVL